MKRSVAHSLLGILSLRAMSGYDIRKFVRENIGYFWKESYGQIYPMLKRMAAEGLVDVRVERNSGKPDRQVYSLNHRPPGTSFFSSSSLAAWPNHRAWSAMSRNFAATTKGCCNNIPVSRNG